MKLPKKKNVVFSVRNMHILILNTSCKNSSIKISYCNSSSRISKTFFFFFISKYISKLNETNYLAEALQE